MPEKTYTYHEFRGLDDYGSEDPARTRSLNNVVVRHNRILGAPGLSKLRSISTVSATTPILGLMPFYATTLASTLFRMTPTKLHKLNTGTDVWDDVTGTNLAGSSTTIPQFVVHKDTLVFTNEGANQIRKLTPSGGNSATLGGTPPYCKALWQAWGFLFAGNVSDDGSTFTAREVRFSDDFDVDWSLCNGNELNFNETSGGVLAGIPFIDLCVVFKSDALMRLSFIGGTTRFSQDGIQGGLGLIAPRSPAALDNIGVCYLDTALRLCLTTGHVNKPLPPFVQKKLEDNLDETQARICVGLNFPDKDTYSLFYPLAGDTWNAGRISFNFRTGEFFHREYTAHEFVHVIGFRYSNAVSSIIVASTTDLVYELDTDVETQDGTAFTRFYDLDWSNLGHEGEKVYKGATFNVAKTVGRVAISVSSDYRNDFIYEKFFDLRGLASSGTYIQVKYRVDPGLKGDVFSTRIKLFHDDGSPVEIITPAKVHYEPLSSYQGRTPSTQTSRIS